MSEDEKVTRDILLHEPPTHLIQVMDAKNLRRGLTLSLQLLEMKLPFFVVLNMWDEAEKPRHGDPDRLPVGDPWNPHLQDRGHPKERP